MKRALLTPLLLALPVLAWDGQREGFLLGIGEGAGSISIGYADATKGTTETISGGVPVTIARIGYAYSNTAAIELYSNSIFPTWTTSYFGYSAVNYQWWSEPEVGANSFFGGLGLLSLSSGQKLKDYDAYPVTYGFGLNFGYAREVAAHTSVEIGLMVGGYSAQNYVGSVTTGAWTASGDAKDALVAAFHVSVGLTGY